ncbi:hypothetical protein CEE37_00115 [candidate division LCP-89 bacterium B3_LCP]|uniref:histidine kinase n=1 Tax=candidate division LCP-89 bacterium B3_LCP TaxID=2012998 RepID=A0A532V4I2_UNCL8|nr:MAG: hypothetical protein CEE37_00115 [candidate division LCP-89 bacterium B3_LCP]
MTDSPVPDIQNVVDDDTLAKEEEHRESVYKRALEEAHGAILITTPEGHIQYANSEASVFYGYSPERMIGINVKDLVAGADRDAVDQVMADLLKKGRWVGEINQPDVNGHERVARLAMSVVPDDYGRSKVLIVSATDVSQLRILESQLLQAQKLEAIGLLTSGIAHNINSPLSAIIMTAEMAKLNNPDIKEFDDVLQAAFRIRDIITNLTEKSRMDQAMDVVDINISDLISTELKFLEANIFFKHQVETNLQLQPDIPTIRGLYSDFSQCLQNLFQNALDAMEDTEERTLSISTEYSHSDNRIVLTIIDTGQGIPPEDIPRIFEPFYTTKACKENEGIMRPSGTGLGLSSVKHLLEKNGASIKVESNPGTGTCFCIDIPVTVKIERSKEKAGV